MSLRVRMGPVSLSSRGRVGVHTGPVSWSGGGARRRSGGGVGLLGFLVVVGFVIFAVMWPLSTWGHAIHLTPSWHQLMNRDKSWMHRHYPLVGLRYVGALAALLVVLTPVIRAMARASGERRAASARSAELAYQQWLASPPPPLVFPGRFTQNWIQQNAPLLHPGQVPPLLEELRARGWTEARITRCVRPFLP